LQQVAGLVITYDHRYGLHRVSVTAAKQPRQLPVTTLSGMKLTSANLLIAVSVIAPTMAELEIQRPALVSQRDSGNERHLVLIASPNFAANALSTEVSVVDFDVNFKPMADLAMRHDAVDLVVQQPCFGVTHAEMASECQRSKTPLGLADQVDGQKSGCEQQLGVLEQVACDQRGLVPIRLALEEIACAGAIT